MAGPSQGSRSTRIAGYTRRQDVSEAWGLNRLTPTFRAGERIGWQMACNHPQHAAKAACQKTRSISIQGEDVCLQLLKYWAVLGLQCSSKAEHGAQWEVVMSASTEGNVPSESDLDAMMWHEWPEAGVADGVGASSSSRARLGGSKGRTGPAISLAPAAGGDQRCTVSSSASGISQAKAPAPQVAACMSHSGGVSSSSIVPAPGAKGKAGRGGRKRASSNPEPSPAPKKGKGRGA